MTITYRDSFSTEQSSATDIAVSRYEDEKNTTIILTICADYGRVSSQSHLTVEDAKNLIDLLTKSLEEVAK